jgi:hypothetical protein
LTLNHKKVQRAIEFFEYNLQVQTGKMECKIKKTVVLRKKKAQTSSTDRYRYFSKNTFF